MPLISRRQLIDHAVENDYGLPEFNVNNMEQMLAIMKAADATNSPVIMQASRGARKFANDIVLAHLIRAGSPLENTLNSNQGRAFPSRTMARP